MYYEITFYITLVRIVKDSPRFCPVYSSDVFKHLSTTVYLRSSCVA